MLKQIKSLVLFIISLFVLSNISARNYYWVGNGGDWSDASHWSIKSGGQGGAGIPGKDDNAIFDIHSFTKDHQLITANSVVDILGIYWQALGLDNNLEINQDFVIHDKFILQNKINIYGKGKIIFEKPNVNEVIIKTSAFTNIVLPIEFKGKANYIFTSNFESNSKVSFYSGSFNFSSIFKAHEIQFLPKGKLILDWENVAVLTKKPLLINNKNIQVLTNNQTYFIIDENAVEDSDFSALKSKPNIIHDKTACGTGPGEVQFDITITIDTTYYGGYHVQCKDSCNGIVTVNVTGGVGPFSYQWVGGPTTATWSEACAGTQIVLVTDLGQSPPVTCSESVSLSDPALLSAFVINSQEPTCFGYNDGFIFSSAVGGSGGNYTYTWTPNVSSTGNAVNLTAGNYALHVVDSNNCTFDTVFVLNEPPQITFQLDSFNVTCNGECNGMGIVSNISGGSGTYVSYQWDDPSAQNATIATGLCAGLYHVTVTDDVGCIGTDSVQVLEPAPITFDSSQTNISCGGASDGTVSVFNIAGGVPPYSHLWNTGATTPSLSNLCPGTYSDTLTDANGCDTVITFVVTEPPILTTTTSITDVTCNGACDGTAATSPSGGTPGYTYLWNTGATSSSISNLCPGQYYVDITDANGCTVSDTVQITEPLPLAANTSATDASCNGVCDGTATANPTGGTSPFSYSWTPGGQTSQSINSLCAGTYYVTIIDANGCTTQDSATVSEPALLTVSVSGTDITCNGLCDGTTTTSVSGGTSPYTYSWSNGATSANLTGLCSGTYFVTVTDANGCSASGSYTINEPSSINPNVTTVDNLCFGDCNGTATANPTGGAGGYTYNWNTTPAQNTQTAAGLCAGSYTVIVTDANGCTDSQTITINEPTALSSSTSQTDVTCYGSCDGTASVSVSGGTGSYSYSWNTTPVQTTSSASNLCAGQYIVTITDANNCNISDTVTINQPDSLAPNVSFTDMSCNGVCDGTATALVTGGTPPYSYSWSNGATSQSISGLCAGNYTVTVTDSRGCTNQETITISNPPVLTTSTNAVNASCGTICDGVATTFPSGGTSPYSYNWNDPYNQNTPTADSLCAGDYVVTVTDAGGCSVTDTVTINELITINITTGTITISCNGVCDGQATANPSGGASPYTYQWSDGQTTQTATGLCPGTYTVTATDANGCASTVSVTIPTDPAVLVTNATSTDVSCYGSCDGSVNAAPSGGTPPYNVVWTPASITPGANNLCPGQYVVSVTDANGCNQTDTLTVKEPDSIALNEVVVSPNCNGDCNGSITLNPTGGTAPYTYLWNTGATSSSISNLCAGTYNVIVTDANGCTNSRNITVTEPALLSASPLPTDVSCFGACDGTAAVIVGGGTAPYTYFWSPGGQTTPSISGLCPGNYSVLITDANGCTTNQNVTINEPAQVAGNLTSTPPTCNGSCDGSITANPTGGTPGYTYNWSNGATTQTISNLCSGSYTVTITDANGCSVNESYTLNNPNALTVSLDSVDVSCNGACDGQAIANISGGTTPYTINWMPGNFSTSTISNLCAGTYSVTVTDANGCVFTGNVNVDEPNTISATATVTDANCGFCDGVISVSVSGGTVPYTHSWSNGDNGAIITNLCPGFYTDTITDLNGCTYLLTTSVSNPTGPSGVTPTIVDASCNGVCDGSASIIPIGGTPGYTYNWTPGGYTTSSVNGLCANTYNITVTDAAGCQLNTSINVNEPSVITANISSTDATCSGNCDGTASVSPSGGTPPYTYSWSNGATTSSVSGLCVGNVSVTITDANGCSTSASATINAPTALSLSTSTTDASCNASCDGSATVTVSGGTAPYTYLWDDVLSQSTSTATGLCAGNYNVTVTDANGCSATASVTVNEPSLISVSSTVNDATCGNCDGNISVSASGGTSPYTYLWNNGVPGPSVNALCAGIYTVTVTDANGCTYSENITVSNINGPATSSTKTDATCNGVCDGVATVSASGGVAPYTYLWSPGGQTTASVSGLCSGTSNVAVTDANGCTSYENITINDNTSITATTSTTDASCNGACDGSATITPTGGVPPYTYAWSTGHTINAVGGLCAGNYSVTVTDALVCSSVFNVTINEPSTIALTANAVAATCFGSCNGSVNLTVSGGTAPYTYLWSTGATTQNISALCAGNYSVTVTDANGCSANTSVNVPDGIAITATFTQTDATCGNCDGTATVSASGGAGAPYTYLWQVSGNTSTTESNLCPGAYNVDVTDNAGCTQTFTVLINNVNGPSISTNADSVNCNGSCDGLAYVNVSSGVSPYTYQWDDPALQTNDTAFNLCAGLYNIVVQDANGCISVDSVSVNEPPLISANLTATNPTCAGICDGTITANPANGSGPYTYLWNTVATTQTISNLCAGTYSVTVTDNKGCSVIDSVTLTNPTTINLTVSGTDATCNSACDGTALVTASGGTPPYTYLWSDGQINSLATGLCAGSYTITVTDANGCSASGNVTINEPAILTTSSSVTDVSCYGNCDGTITTSPSGGTSPYTYFWSDGQTTQTASGLCAGTYDVIVIDANNCTAYDTLTVNNPTAITGNITVNDATCNVCDGDATANPANGVAPYTYLWSDGQTTQTAVGLCAGVYYVTITDNTGCSDIDTVIVNNATGPSLTMASTDETCSGLCNGSATVTATGGTTPYSYQWDDPNNQTLATASNLCAGFYTVTVTDANNCSSIDTVTIQTSTIGATIISTTDVSCYGNCDGTAVANATSGTPNYSYVWNPTGQNSSSATNLCAGNYVVTITDANNCSDSATATINEPMPLAITINSTNISCNGSCDGSAMAMVTGGTAPYTYSWNTLPLQTTQSISNLCAGQYIVTVTDANNCTISDTVTITEPAPIVPNETLTNPGCGLCDGSITLNPTGGTAPYSYSWNNGAVTPVINNLCAGTYTVDITDATGCTLNYIIALSSVNAPTLTTTATDVSCNSFCDGQVSVSASGGNPPYSYAWSPGNQTTSTISGQCAGIYSVNVTDAANCVAVAVDTVNEPDPITANLLAYDAYCNGDCNGSAVSVTLGGTPPYAYSWTDPNNQTTDSISGLCAGMVSVTITDNNGCSVVDSVMIYEPSAISVTVSNTDVSCSSNCDATASATVTGGTTPYTYNWLPSGFTTQNVSNICFGANTVTVTDNNGCSTTQTFNVAAADTVMATAPADTTVCSGATLQLVGSSYNANSVEWLDLSTGTSLSNNDTLNISSVTSGTFCYVYFAYGNCTASDTVCVTIEDLPVVDAGPDQTVFEGTIIQLNATGGVSYTWEPADSLTNNTIPNPTDTVVATTTYYVTAISAGGCIGTDSVTITVIPKINFPDGITPNGDGKNDTWVIDFINEYPNAVVEIYNRWGELLYRSEDYQNDWDGTYKGKPLPVGTYYYVIDLNEEGLKPFTGPLTIMR